MSWFEHIEKYGLSFLILSFNYKSVIISILNYPCFLSLRSVTIFLVFFSPCKLLFSGFLQFEGDFKLTGSLQQTYIYSQED